MSRFAIGISFLLVFAAIGAEGQSETRHGHGMRHDAQVSMVRHHYVRRNGLEAHYAARRRPRQPTTEDVTAGQALFGRHCASCHGERGAGDVWRIVAYLREL